MRFKFAHAVSIAAAVAMATACGKKDEGGASTAAPAASSAAVSAASSPAPAPASEATVVRIGHVAPLTGLQAHLGKDNENGARLALEEISAQGLTIDGHSIRLVLDGQDDAADPRVGTEAAQKLVDDHVIAVIGHMNSIYRSQHQKSTAIQTSPRSLHQQRTQNTQNKITKQRFTS